MSGVSLKNSKLCSQQARWCWPLFPTSEVRYFLIPHLILKNRKTVNGDVYCETLRSPRKSIKSKRLGLRHPSVLSTTKTSQREALQPGRQKGHSRRLALVTTTGFWKEGILRLVKQWDSCAQASRPSISPFLNRYLTIKSFINSHIACKSTQINPYSFKLSRFSIIILSKDTDLRWPQGIWIPHYPVVNTFTTWIGIFHLLTSPNNQRHVSRTGGLASSSFLPETTFFRL